MTTDEMILDFQDQLKKIVDEIKDLDTQINVKKEQYFRLQGAVEALNLAKSTQSAKDDLKVVPKGQIDNDPKHYIPPGVPMPNPDMIPDHDWEVVVPPPSN